MLQVFSFNVYSLHDPGDTLSVVAPLVTKIFDILPDVFIEPFSITTDVGDFVVARRVFRSCPIFFRNIVTWVDLVEHDMVDFDVILGMDWLHA